VNEWYWLPKLARNVERDRRADRALAEAGWTVLRVWEHVDPAEAADRVILAVQSHT
jgi:DNA mismatch endonuclease (patch repair protein)